jgi:hypothetical protein
LEPRKASLNIAPTKIISTRSHQREVGEANEKRKLPLVGKVGD